MMNAMKLLVAIDFSESAESVIAEAEKLAKTLSAKVFLLHAMPPLSPIMDNVDDAATLPQPGIPFQMESLPRLSASAKEKLIEISGRMQAEGIECAIILTHNNEVEAIIEESKKNRIDMILLGSHGHGALYHLLIGSVSEGVIRKASCPVIIIPSKKQ
ncbi:universal stress protein [Candidatus Chlorobium masyuteum]|uniref:universal stress protein n=1 Tax=Candidatus Chlorobium masyuteum TaxID=2716876 RepID=UPI001422C43C|nr:universal stress protein [Candidatus Chlorobium masyuteum]